MINDRNEFLISMYNQMYNDINRHILVIWQAIGVLAGSATLFVLIYQKLLDINLGITIIVLFGFWAILTMCDSAFWYNRNLVIIANIERQFLNSDDDKLIHYYFKRHREHSFIDHLRIQFWLVFLVIIIALIYHFSSLQACSPFLLIILPYVVFIVLGIYSLYYWFGDRKKKYEEFVKNSPGKLFEENK